MNNESKPYIPISCSFYDYLETAATLKQTASISYKQDNSLLEIESRIKNLFVKDKIEYMELENGQLIRLDLLVTFNGKPLQNRC